MNVAEQIVDARHGQARDTAQRFRARSSPSCPDEAGARLFHDLASASFFMAQPHICQHLLF